MGSERIDRRRADGSACPSGTDLRAWIDGELDPRREAEMSLHAASCPACRSRAQEDRRIGKAIRAGSVVLTARPPALDARRILDRVRRIGDEEVRAVRFLRRLSAVAALLILGSGVLIAWSASDGPRQAEARASIRHLAAPAGSLGLIDEENSILIVVRR